MTIRKLAVVFAAFALVVAACGDDDDATATTAATTAAPTTTAAPATTTAAPTTTAATTTEAPPPAIGTADNPIEVVFVPSGEVENIITGGELLEQALGDATGLVFEVSVPTSYAATIEGMCASPENTIGFIPAQAYVLGNQLCGIDVALKSIRFGYDVYWSQFLVARDSDIQSVEDLAGKKWGIPDVGSTSGFLVPNGLLQSKGVDVSSMEIVEHGGSHTSTARSIYLGEVDVATTFFSPPVDNDDNVVWDGSVAGADIPDDLISQCVLNEEGSDLDCGGILPKDARRGLREEAPDVINKVRILDLSAEIPNDTMSFSPEFPQDLRGQIVQALFDFAEDDPDGFEAAFDEYSWTGVSQTNDTEFDFIRGLVQALGLTVGDLG